MELVIHLPSRVQKARVPREFIARKALHSAGGKSTQKNTVANSDEHPQLQLKLEAAMRSQCLNRKETLSALADAGQGRVVSGWDVGWILS